MDPLISWFQPEQRGPALDTWNRIWDRFSQTKNFDSLPPTGTANQQQSQPTASTPINNVVFSGNPLPSTTPTSEPGQLSYFSTPTSSLKEGDLSTIDKSSSEICLNFDINCKQNSVPNSPALVVQRMMSATDLNKKLPPISMPAPEFIPLTLNNTNGVDNNASNNIDQSKERSDQNLNNGLNSDLAISGANNPSPTSLTNHSPEKNHISPSASAPALSVAANTQETEATNSMAGSKRKRENRASTFDFNTLQYEYTKEFGGTPWKAKEKSYSVGLRGLHEEMQDFCTWMKPTVEEQAVRLDAFKRIKGVILDLWPKAVVDYFGSFRTSLYLPTSDIDVVVIGNWEVLPLWTLEKALKTNDIAEASTIKVLDKASVPIIKLTDKRTDIRVDVSFNMNNGVKSAKLISDFLKLYPPLTPLVYVLKQFLLQRNLNEVFTGGISSYCLILMAISFLQQHPSQMTSLNGAELNLGVLLIEFFELYARHFNYAQVGIRVKEGGSYVPKNEIQQGMVDGQQPSMLCIEDPLQPGNDIGRSSYGIIRVRQAFEYAYIQMAKILHPPTRFLIRDDGSYLARIIRVTDDVVKYRLYLRGKFYALNLTGNGVLHINRHNLPHTTYASAASKAKSQKISKRRDDQNICSRCSSPCTSELSSDAESDVSVHSAASRSSNQSKRSCSSVSSNVSYQLVS